MHSDVLEFLALLEEAAAGVGNPYFALPIDGQDLPVFRERVYSYELYHQLRSRWPANYGFVLNGEVDKHGHPLLRDMTVADKKPDLLVHGPGHMNRNLVVVEIKTVNAPITQVSDDLRKLTAFCREAGYQLGVLLFFGAGLTRDAVRDRCVDAARRADGPVDRDVIALYVQEGPSMRARRVPWERAAV